MRKYLVLLLVCLLALPAFSQARKKYRSHSKSKHNYQHNYERCRNGCYSLDDSYMSFENDAIIIFSDYFDEEVEITEDYRLYIDGDEIDLSGSQKKMVSKFYAEALDLREIADKMGRLGGKMGAIGGQMGTVGGAIARKATSQAYLSLAYGLSDHYDDADDDDLEELEEKLEALEDKLEDMEDELDDDLEDSEDRMEDLSDRMEELGEKMEDLGDEMEDETDEVEDAFDEMRDEIPALSKLDW